MTEAVASAEAQAAETVNTQQQETVANITPEEKANADIISEAGPAESKDFKSLFDEKAPTEAELMGSDEPVPDTAQEAEKIKAEAAAREKAEAEAKGKAETEEKAKADEAKAKAEPEKVPPPPKGFVPLAALHEERGKRQALEAEAARLRRENDLLSALPSAVESKEVPDDFKVLTEAEEDKLMEEDQVAYQKYQRDLRKYSSREASRVAMETREAGIVESSRIAMEAVVPDIFDDKSDTNKKLSDFAAENGLPPSILAVLTDPRTKIILNGEKTPVLAGKATADVLKFLNSTYQKLQAAKPVDEAAIKAKLEAELTESITAKVTKEIMGKLKNPKESFRSITDAPGSGEIPLAGLLSEVDFAKLSAEEQRKYLGG